MLNRKHRFHGYGSLKRVYTRSQSVRSNFVGLKYANRPNRPYRVAVVVGKKVHKSAVKRNRIRRRIYELVRKSKYTPDNKDLAFIVYSDQIIKLSNQEIVSLIDDLLKKAS